MKELFNGIYAQFTAEVEGATDLYNTDAPATAVFPYVVMRLVTGSSGGTFTEDTEEDLIQFNIYDDDPSSETVCDIWQSISDAFNEQDITIVNFEVISLSREGEPYLLNKWEIEGVKVWDCMSTYNFIVQRN